MKLSVEGGEREFDGGILFCCCLWDFVALPCPLLKILHTLVKHTQFLHRTICSDKEKGRKKLLAEKEDRALKTCFISCINIFTYVSFLALL